LHVVLYPVFARRTFWQRDTEFQKKKEKKNAMKQQVNFEIQIF